MNNYRCDKCGLNVPYKDFDTRVWRCRGCAGPYWWVTAKRLAEFAWMCGVMTAVFAVGGLVVLAGVTGVVPAMAIGAVLGWAGLIGLLIYQG